MTENHFCATSIVVVTCLARIPSKTSDGFQRFHELFSVKFVKFVA